MDLGLGPEARRGQHDERDQPPSPGPCLPVLAEAVIKALSSHYSLSDQMLQDGNVFDELADVLLPEAYTRARDYPAQSPAA